ncbi:MAG: DUF169 domain-containing protein [Planctomycetota bacterium]|jgi:hypothetical protein
MNVGLRDDFVRLWGQYFPDRPLPICFYYSDEAAGLDVVPPPEGHRCIIGQLARVRRGESLCFGRDSVGCFGGRRYLGFTGETPPDFDYFLSCGIAGKLEGERYKKSPEIVREWASRQDAFEAPGRYIVFKRWDKLAEAERPAVVVFIAEPDVLSGLFTLSGFAESDPDGVRAPFGAGCASIVQYPLLETRRERPRSVIGMFDVSARPFVPAQTLSFAVPMEKFAGMVEDMEESFLITDSWDKVRRRMRNRQENG